LSIKDILTIAFSFMLLFSLNLSIDIVSGEKESYFEYPTETWIIERQDYFGKFLDWDFIPIDGQSGDKRVWNFTWEHLAYYEVYDEYTGEETVYYNPIFEIRKAINNDVWLREIYDKTDDLWFKSWGDFKSDVIQLDKYPIIPEDKEDFIGLHNNIDIFNFDNGSFLVSFKDKWKLGKKITIGFGSTITYNGGSNTITVTGGTEGSPIDFWDVWNASNVNGWNVVNNTCDTQFKFWCKLQIGDGSTTTWFADESKQIIFASGIQVAWNPLINLKNNSHFRLGKVIDADNRVTKTGCSIFNCEQSVFNVGLFDNRDGGIVELYASTFSSPTRFSFMMLLGGTKIYECILAGYMYLRGIYGSVCDVDAYELYIGCHAPSGFQATTGVFENILLSGIGSYGAIRQAYITQDLTLTSTVIRNCIAPVRFDNSAYDLYLIDSDLDVWSISWVGTNTGSLFRQYSFNLMVLNQTGDVLSGFNVTLFDKNEDQVFSTTTHANGSITEQIVTRGFYNQTYGNTLQDNAPFHLIVYGDSTYSNYDSDGLTFGDMINWEIALMLPSTETSLFFPFFLLLCLIGCPIIIIFIKIRR